MADPGRGPGAPATPPPLLFLDQTQARRAKKIFFLETGPPPLDDHPPLSQGLYPALSCTYIILVAILLIIGQLIDRFSVSVFHYALILQGTR